MTIDIDTNACLGRWHTLQAAPAPGLVTDRLIFAEQSAGDVPDLCRALDAARAEIAGLTAANQRLLNHLHAATPDLVTAQQRADQAEDRATDLAKQVDELKKRICLVITCTDCGEALEWDGGIVHFRNLDEAKDILDDENWRVIDGNPMCGDCLLKPHDFKPEQPNGLTCERCDLEADDHEPVAAKAEVA